MVRKKLAVAVAAIGALQANLALALGMGDLSLNSALNQPLEAEIKLLNTRDLDESQVKIKLADKQDFDRAGVSREYFLTNIKFEVELDDNGNGVIKLSTRDPVIEPYLNFLVEARWPTGRMLREYTVLLDLPVFSKSDAAPVTAASSSLSSQLDQPAQPAPSAQPSSSMPATTATSSARQTLTQGSLQAGENYRVRQNDTLWEIAAQSRPNSSVSVQQTMITIQRINPNAFIGGNINRLKAGYVLRLPTEAEIDEISGSEAIREVAVQNRAWRTGESLADNTGGAQLDASTASGDSDSGYAEEARLSIATAGDSETGASGDGSGGSAALRNQLDASQEDLSRAQRENDELNGRLDDMESKVATLQRLLELKEAQLSELQDQLGQEQADSASAMPSMEADTEVMDETPAADEMMEPADQSMDTEMGADDGMESEPAATPDSATVQSMPAEKPEPAAKPKPPVPAPAPAADPLSEILNNPIYLAGAAGLVVLLLAAAIYARKRRAAEAEGVDELDELEVDSDAEDMGEIAFESDEDLGDLDFDADAGDMDEADQLAAELEQEIAGDQAAEADVEEPATAVQSETGDAVAEADIYIAYGRYQQAIDLLATAVSQEPQRSDLQVKLLEVYVETRDKPAFQQQYMALQALGDDEAVGQVKEMLSSVDGVADWLDDLDGSGGAISDADMDADLIEDSAEDLAEAEARDDELDLDLDLDLDDLGMTQESPAITDADLDLDLELSESDDISTADTQAVETMPETAPEESLSLDSGEEFELELDSSGDTIDLGELDLGDMDSSEGATPNAEPEVELSMAAEEPATEEGFDLDLEGDSDLDLDMGDLGATDLSDLAAEFGDGPETASSDSFDLELPDSGESMDFGELAEPEEETLSFDAVDTADLGSEFELSDAAEPASEPTADFTPEPVAEPAPAPMAADESFAEPMGGEGGSGEEFDFLADTDEVATKLDLARAYIDMGDTEGAKDILDEVLQEGNDEQKQEANSLMERV